MALTNDPSAVKIINLDEETVVLAKVNRDGVLPEGEYEVKVEIIPVGPAPAGVSCGLCCQTLKPL
jgi:hypothetical protein